MDWYGSLASIESRGSTAPRAASLADMADRRRMHLGQFFTPAPVAQLMWKIASQAMEGYRARSPSARLSILDNSVGTGRLLQFADPAVHLLFGVDVDAGAVGALGETAKAAGFECEFRACGMEEIRPRQFDVALINPAFSVSLSSPLLEPYPCTCYGRFGDNTSALSHAYALAQAVEAARIVVALLPASFAAEVATQASRFLYPHHAIRLRAHIRLPGGLFREEGADVRVALLVFDAAPRRQEEFTLASIEDTPPPLGLTLKADYRGVPKLGFRHVADTGPSITRAVTGQNRVRVVHDGRRIGLRFACGLVEAKVLNAVLIARVAGKVAPGHRLPRGVRYTGQGALDLEVHLAQPDPLASFEALLATIRQAGGVPEVDSGLTGYFRRRVRNHAIRRAPFGHTVWVAEGTVGGSEQVEGVARRDQVADPTVWASKLIRKGTRLQFRRGAGGQFDFRFGERDYQIDAQALEARFALAAGAAQSGWVTVHRSLQATFAPRAREIERRMVALGIDRWLSFGYQKDDLVELTLKGNGIAGWQMGLGKARLALALVLLSGCKHGLIAVEAGLVDEMLRELRGLPIPATEWQVIDSPARLATLRRINLVSYERLRLPRVRKSAKRGTPQVADTYAGALRRRIGLMVCDEGDLLSNPTSWQSRAVWQVSPKRRIVLSGTPLGNMPRDVLPILAFACGDGTAAQPYGWHRGYLEANWRASMSQAQRGIDAFREDFVTVAWSTVLYEETLVHGAKREIPRIANLERYRALLAPHVKRRTLREPAVAEHIKIPEPMIEVIDLQWDEAHLAYYLKVADEFGDYYRRMRDALGEGKQANLVAILAKLRAVLFACDFPQHGVEGFGAYMPLTSKQRWAINRLVQLGQEGTKSILYAENPGQLELIHQHLSARGVDSLVFDGKTSIAARTQALAQRWRFGPCNVLLASLGVTQKGLNLYQAKNIILLSRSWSATTEQQAIARALRPQQTQRVAVELPHLAGSINVYQAQMTEFKADAAAAGLDWAIAQTDTREYLQLDAVLEQFVADLAGMRGLAHHEMRQKLRLAA